MGLTRGRQLLQEDDPLTDGLEIEPPVILGVNFVILMASIMSFSQAVRMYIHAVCPCLPFVERDLPLSSAPSAPLASSPTCL